MGGKELEFRDRASGPYLLPRPCPLSSASDSSSSVLQLS